MKDDLYCLKVETCFICCSLLITAAESRFSESHVTESYNFAFTCCSRRRTGNLIEIKKHENLFIKLVLQILDTSC